MVRTTKKAAKLAEPGSDSKQSKQVVPPHQELKRGPIQVDGTGHHRKVSVRMAGMTELAEALGSRDEAFLKGILSDLLAANTSEGKTDENALNFMFAFIKGMTPRDPLETTLFVQMARTHSLAMKYAGYLKRADGIEEINTIQNTLNKLLKSFAAQMDTLKRYRAAGEQKITVQHVTVSEGSQAILGNVSQVPLSETDQSSKVSMPRVPKNA